MRVFIFVLLTFIFNHTLLAKQRPNSTCQPRVPNIGIVEAIEIVKKSNISKKAIFVDEAKLNCSNNLLTWSIGYRLKDYESGHLFARVKMDGSIKVYAAVKDG